MIARYEDDWYAGFPAVTRNRFGKGLAIDQACRDTGSLKDAVADSLLAELELASVVDAEGSLPHGVTAHSRSDGETRYVFVENYSPVTTATVRLRGEMENMLTGEKAAECTLKPYSFAIFRSI